MRQKQWFLSAVLFLVSLCFLYYSKNLFPPAVHREPTAAASLPAVQVQKEQVILLANENYYPFFLEYIRNAKKSIHGTIFLFKANSYRDNEPAELMRELIAASKRKVDVDLVMELSADVKEYNQDNHKAAETLAKSGVKVRVDLDSITTHAKAFVIDGRYCFVGSHNFTHAAMAMNQELSLFVDSPQLGAQIEQFLHQIPVSGKL